MRFCAFLSLGLLLQVKGKISSTVSLLQVYSECCSQVKVPIMQFGIKRSCVP